MTDNRTEKIVDNGSTLDSLLTEKMDIVDNLWPNIEDAEIELEFDKQVTNMYFKKEISIRQYTKLKTFMSKLKGKDTIRECTKSEKSKGSTNDKALKNAVAEYLTQASQKSEDSRASRGSVDENSAKSPASPKESSNGNNGGGATAVAAAADSTTVGSDKREQMKQKILENAARKTVANKCDGGGLWSSLFCCASDRGENNSSGQVAAPE